MQQPALGRPNAGKSRSEKFGMALVNHWDSSATSANLCICEENVNQLRSPQSAKYRPKNATRSGAANARQNRNKSGVFTLAPRFVRFLSPFFRIRIRILNLLALVALVLCFHWQKSGRQTRAQPQMPEPKLRSSLRCWLSDLVRRGSVDRLS
jgi:hypothetical protein